MRRAGYLFTETGNEKDVLKDTIFRGNIWPALGISDNQVTVVTAENFWKCSESVIGNKGEAEPCEELVLLSADLLGPLYDLVELFRKMEDKQADFWGLVRNYASFDGFRGKYPGHVDPRFLVIRQSCFAVILSDDFQRRVSDQVAGGLPFLNAFSYLLEESGCRAQVYCDTQLWKNSRNCNNFCFYYGKAYELVKEYKCPFIPCDVFAAKNLTADDGRDAGKTLEYITKELKYPEKELWRILLDKFDLSDLYAGLHLDYVVENDFKGADSYRGKAVVIVHVYYEDLFEKIMEYMENIPDDIDIYITTSEKRNVERLSRMLEEKKLCRAQILLVPNRGRDCSALFIGCRELAEKYEYICFLHDKKTSGNNGALTIGETFMANLFENLLGGAGYIRNILQLFQEHESLGLLAPPIPVHGQYFCLKDNAWTSCFDQTVKLAEKIGIKIKVSKEKKPFVLSTAFWCRTEALRPLWDYGFSYEEFCEEPMPEDGTISHAIERILPYVAQKQGYYSGIVMTQGYASLQISNLNYLLCQTVARLGNEYSISTCRQFAGFDKGKLYDFCRTHGSLYIYGTGLYGKRYAKILTRTGVVFDGFLVSEKQNEQSVEGYNVYGVRELADMGEMDRKNVGVIVAVSEYYQEEIVEILERCGIHEYIIV